MFGLGMRKEHLKGRWESEREKKIVGVKKRLYEWDKESLESRIKVWNGSFFLPGEVDGQLASITPNDYQLTAFNSRGLLIIYI